MRDGASQPEEVTPFRHVLRVERFTSYGLLSRSVTSLQITYHGNLKKQQPARRSLVASAASAFTKKTTGETEKYTRRSSEQVKSSRQSTRPLNDFAETETFTVCVKQEIALWYSLLVELWCGNLAAVHLRDSQLIQQAAENALIINAYILAGIFFSK